MAQRFGCVVRRFPAIDSTMDTAHALARDGAAEGTLVLADTQHAGRGRHGRAWDSPAGQGIYASLIVRPTVPLAERSSLTLAVAVALAQAIESVTRLSIRIKWPNDLWLDSAKVGGILVEGDAAYAVIGFGINVNTDAIALSPGATSLAHALGQPVDQPALLRAILDTLESVYDRWHAEGFAPFATAWRQRATLLGQQVRVTLSGEQSELEGQAVDIDDDGSLLIRHDSGLQTRVTAGDVVKLW